MAAAPLPFSYIAVLSIVADEDSDKKTPVLVFPLIVELLIAAAEPLKTDMPVSLLLTLTPSSSTDELRFAVIPVPCS